MNTPEIGSVWKHKQRGSTYRVLKTVPLQSNDRAWDNCKLVLYVSEKDVTELWVRPVEEFMDGRFVKLSGPVGLQ